MSAVSLDPIFKKMISYLMAGWNIHTFEKNTTVIKRQQQQKSIKSLHHKLSSTTWKLMQADLS